MELIIPISTLATSLIILAVASFFMIKNAETLMQIIRLSEVATGFILLSVITTLPELTVAIFAIQEGVAGISMGDILGSHIFNVGLVIGMLASLGSLKKSRTLRSSK